MTLLHLINSAVPGVLFCHASIMHVALAQPFILPHVHVHERLSSPCVFKDWGGGAVLYRGTAAINDQIPGDGLERPRPEGIPVDAGRSRWAQPAARAAGRSSAGGGGGRRRQSAASISVSIIKRSARLEPILIKCLH